MGLQWFAYASGMVFTAIAVALSVHLIASHRRHLTNPAQQNLIIYIIIMVPLFAVDSLIGLFEIQASETFMLLLDSIKECYEAFVIASFLKLMFLYMDIDPSSDKEVPDSIKGRHIHHTAPFSYFMKDMHLNKAAVKELMFYCQQFLVLRPAISIAEMLLELLLSEETLERGIWPVVFFVFAVALNVSVTLAVYALIMFYHAFAEELSKDNQRPLAKFLCIKGVVFFAFWQGIIIQILTFLGILHKGQFYSANEIDVALQNWLVCFEMAAIFAPAHLYAFQYEPYIEKPKTT